ncbi:hypothetical protein TWF481_000639 [Arthrobotrys musiformis]|uniref:DUF7587 domain-containing protein n=1 Tax=Arthrobotrys musiformis TaxID=47236 RepID=A0AAV9WNH5_9PEZI
MPLNWDLEDDAPACLDAPGQLTARPGQPWEAEIGGHHHTTQDNIDQEEDKEPETKDKTWSHTQEPRLPALASTTTSNSLEVVVYTGPNSCNGFSSQTPVHHDDDSHTKTSSILSLLPRPPVAEIKSEPDPVIIDLTLSDSESSQESSQHSIGHSSRIRIDSYTAKSINRWPWSHDEKLDLYLLKLAYYITNKEASAVLSQKHRKPRATGSIAAQFAEYKSAAVSKRLYHEVYMAIHNGKLHRYSSYIKDLKAAARRVKVVLQPRSKEEICIPPAPTYVHQNTRTDSRENDSEETDSDSSISSSKWNCSESDGDDQERHDHGERARRRQRIRGTTQPLSPSLLYRAYNPSSHGKNGTRGFLAGTFINETSPIPIVPGFKLPAYDCSLADHITGEIMEHGSYFISTTPSLLWALHKASRMGGSSRISIIDRSKIRQPVQHVAEIKSRLKSKGLLEKVRYSGKLEYVVYAAIGAEAIIKDFSLDSFRAMVDTDNQIQKVLGCSILFDSELIRSLEKLDKTRQQKIRRWSLASVINTVYRYVFNNQEHALEAVFRSNVAIDWELEARME